MHNDLLRVLREEIASVMANAKKCDRAFRALKAFKDNRGGLVFCAVQFREAASALSAHAEQLTNIAETLQTNTSDLPEQLQLDDYSMNGRP